MLFHMIYTWSERCVLPKTESGHLGDGRCKERETQQTERREYEQRAERCGILRANVSLTTIVAYMTTHPHKRPMRMRNMPEFFRPQITSEIFAFVHRNL